MSVLTKEYVKSMRDTLLRSSIKCSERGLYQSAKWIAELAGSLPNLTDFESGDDTDSDSPMRELDESNPDVGSIFTTTQHDRDSEEATLEAKEVPKYLLAKSFFDCREYDRCAAVFLPNVPIPNVLSPPSPTAKTPTPTNTTKGKGKETGTSPEAISGPPSNSLPRLSQKSLFLALYAKYMSGEKRKDEDSEMILGPLDGGATINKELTSIGRSLEGWFAERAAQGLESRNQGWLEYLYGVTLAKSKSEEEAKKWLLKSIHREPFNWGAWQELRDLIGSVEALHAIMPALPRIFMTLLFILDTNQELYQFTDDVHRQLNELETFFPTSPFLKTQRALLFYHSKDFDESESIFSTLLHEDPHRLDSMDHYSNVLYVMSNRPKLAFLAQAATATDKFRPETCCIVGNYYSLKSEHEKAVMYFRRALTLDRSFLSAWTLMGHEYVEMKNTHAAIESYRRAVDINRKDYRAWYGLGQTYEVLEMHHYALFYFQRAAALRPYDAKMWQAVGACYDKIDKPLQSIKAYKRALVANSYYVQPGITSSFGSGASSSGAAAPTANDFMDPETLYQIACVYEKMGEMDEAAAYMELTLNQEEGFSANEDEDGDGDEEGGRGTGVTITTSRARMWLAKWAYGKGDLGAAMKLAEELCEDGFEVEEAKALVRDLRARRELGEREVE